MASSGRERSGWSPSKQIEGFGWNQKLRNGGRHHNNVGDERFTRNPCFPGSLYVKFILRA